MTSGHGGRAGDRPPHYLGLTRPCDRSSGRLPRESDFRRSNCAPRPLLHARCASPLAKGYFARAIGQSGAMMGASVTPRALFAQLFGARAAEAETFFPLGTADDMAQ